jgi:hypothetical protein
MFTRLAAGFCSAFLMLCTLACLAPRAVAAPADQPPPAERAVSLRSAGDAHGWMIVQEPGSSTPALLHFPPRAASGESRPASDGKVRLVQRLRRTPAMIAGVDNRVYLVFDEAPHTPPDAAAPGSSTPPPATPGRAVMSVDAVRTRLGDGFAFVPAGRLDLNPSLPIGGTLLGLADAGIGPAALLSGAQPLHADHPNASTKDAYQLLVLDGREWRRIDLPPGFQSADRLVSLSRRPVLLAHQPDGSLLIFTARLLEDAVRPTSRMNFGAPLFGDDAKRADDDSSQTVQPFTAPKAADTPHAPAIRAIWSRTLIPAAGLALSDQFADSTPNAALQPSWFDGTGGEKVLGIGPTLVALRPRAGGADAVTLTAQGAWPLARFDSLHENFAVAGIDASQRLLVLSIPPRDDPAPPSAPLPSTPPAEKTPPTNSTHTAADKAAPAAGQRLFEVSAATGRELYAGPPRSELPITATDFRLMVALLLGIMVLVLVMVMKPGLPGEVVLPPNASMAEPGRRFLATLIDALAAALIASRLSDVSLAEAIVPVTWFTEHGLAFLGLFFASGIAIGTAGEAIAGKSLGKFLTGCEVVLARPTKPGAAAIVTTETTLEEPPRPAFHLLLLRNIVKWLLPPIAAIALVDPTLRHRGDILAGAAVVVFTDPEDDID